MRTGASSVACMRMDGVRGSVGAKRKAVDEADAGDDDGEASNDDDDHLDFLLGDLP